MFSIRGRYKKGVTGCIGVLILNVGVQLVWMGHVRFLAKRFCIVEANMHACSMLTFYSYIYIFRH